MVADFSYLSSVLRRNLLHNKKKCLIASKNSKKEFSKQERFFEVRQELIHRIVSKRLTSRDFPKIFLNLKTNVLSSKF